MQFSFSKKDSKHFLLMSINSIIATFLFLIIVRNRTLSGLIEHLLKGDIIFILKLLCLCFFFFVFQICCLWWCRKNPILIQKLFKGKTNKKSIIIFSTICLALSSFLYLFTSWCSKNYPIGEPETVFFVLSSPLDDAKDIFFANFFKFVVLPTICILVIFIVVLIKQKYIQKFTCIMFIILFPISFIYFWKTFQINVYFGLLKSYKEPAQFSEFWDKNFINPQIEQIKFPEKKRNLIFIILESMESSFADTENGGLFEENCIPNLTRLAKENINFSHTEKIGGGLDATNTGWTIAAMTAKLLGVPQNLSAASNPTKLPYFLPKATGLTDILSANGYVLRFLCGSDKGFASRDRLLEDHGNVEIHDLNWYIENGFLPTDYHNGFWGFEDLHLYEFAKQEINELSKSDKPFCLSFLTVDTHTPEGFICSKCENNTENDSQIKTVIHCTDQQIADFIDWCKTQSWFENTTIIITGDHYFMVSDITKTLFNESDRFLIDGIGNKDRKILSTTVNRRWIDIFINSAIKPNQGATQNRQFSSFDIFPTTLASIGVTIPNNGIAFGRNLFSGTPTIVEQYGFDFVNAELSKKMIQFEELAY